MKRSLVVLSAVLSGSASVFVAGCGSSTSTAAKAPSSPATAASTASGSGTKTIAFSHSASQVPYVVALQKAVVAAGTKQGFHVLVDNDQSVLEKQVSSVTTWVNQKVSAINLLPQDPGAFAPLEKKAESAGICWTTYTVPMAGSDGNIGWSPTESGTVVGKNAVSWINANDPTAKVLMLTASPFPTFAARTTIPVSLIKSQTKATIVSSQDALDQATGLTVTQTVLRQHPDLRVVVAFNDDGALGAARAFADAHIDSGKVYIAGQDGSQEGLTAMLDSKSYLKADAAIPLAPLAAAIVAGTQSCLAGNHKVNANVGLVLAKPSDPAGVKKLLAAFTS